MYAGIVEYIYIDGNDNRNNNNWFGFEIIF